MLGTADGGLKSKKGESGITVGNNKGFVLSVVCKGRSAMWFPQPSAGFTSVVSLVRLKKKRTSETGVRKRKESWETWLNCWAARCMRLENWCICEAFPWLFLSILAGFWTTWLSQSVACWWTDRREIRATWRFVQPSRNFLIQIRNILRWLCLTSALALAWRVTSRFTRHFVRLFSSSCTLDFILPFYKPPYWFLTRLLCSWLAAYMILKPVCCRALVLFFSHHDCIRLRNAFKMCCAKQRKTQRKTESRFPLVNIDRPFRQGTASLSWQSWRSREGLVEFLLSGSVSS